MTRPLAWTTALLFLVFCPAILPASDWTDWRGPYQTGVSPDKNLPDNVAQNILWKAPYGCRSTPLVLKDRVYLLNYVSAKTKDDAIVHESIRERVMCLDAKDGKKIWEYDFPIFHTDIVTSRLGWTNLAADPATGNIYAHGTQGLFICLDGKNGKLVWQHSMTEEYGRISGYGGRVTSPVVDEDLAILGMCNSSAGDQAKPANRFVAFDKNTGEVVWWSEPAPFKGTYYSAPVIATINGQRLLISGGSNGSVFAIKVRTGEPVWHYVFSLAPINSSPVVQGNFVYIGQGEESPGTSVQGRVVCLDASQVEKGQPKLVWKVDGIKARYASPIVHENRLYVPDDGGKLYCLDVKTGDTVWKYSYGRVARGSPVWADGKIYVGEVGSRFHILQPGPKKCKNLDEHFFTSPDGSDVEINGSPAVAEGRVYFSTSDEVLCIGRKDGISVIVKEKKNEAVVSDKIAHLQIIPADVALLAGQSKTFKARAFDGNGNFIKEVKAEWSLPAPMPPPGVKANPPALKGEITADGKLTVDAKVPGQQSIAVGKFEGIAGKARVRVAPGTTYFNDFSKIPDGAAPAGWINAQGKYFVKTVNGNKVLAKVNIKATPLVARGNAYITLPTAKDYTISCDVLGTQVGSDMPEIGVVANRYSLYMVGNVQKLRLMSWDAIPRIDKTVDFKFQPGVWYTLKLTAEVANGKGVIRGKAWPRDEKEPAVWTVEVNDSYPIGEGSAAVYGYVTGVDFDEKNPGPEILYDNLRITPNKDAGKGAALQKKSAESVMEDRPAPNSIQEMVAYPEPMRRRPFLPLLWRLRR